MSSRSRTATASPARTRTNGSTTTPASPSSASTGDAATRTRRCRRATPPSSRSAARRSWPDGSRAWLQRDRLVRCGLRLLRRRTRRRTTRTPRRPSARGMRWLTSQDRPTRAGWVEHLLQRSLPAGRRDQRSSPMIAAVFGLSGKIDGYPGKYLWQQPEGAVRHHVGLQRVL